MPFSVREGINIFLAGFVPTENLRFRDEELNFKLATNTGKFPVLIFHVLKCESCGPSEFSDQANPHQTSILSAELFENPGKTSMYSYPSMTKTMRGSEVPGTPVQTFILHVERGQFTDSEIVVMLGENGTGKTTFIRMLAGLLKSDEQSAAEAEEDYETAHRFSVPQLNVSYKPQKISPKFQGTVRMLLHKKIRDAYIHPQFVSDVMRPMSMDAIMENGIQTLSGGELQRVAIVLCLGTAADIYLVDEPSAYLDSEQRIAASKVIKRFIMHAKKTAFVVEHDFIMATYLADRVIVYEGNPGVETTANSPQVRLLSFDMSMSFLCLLNSLGCINAPSLLSSIAHLTFLLFVSFSPNTQSLIPGMNTFLKQLNITFRRDPSNFRPRINKMDSVKDKEQKAQGNYFYLED